MRYVAAIDLHFVSDPSNPRAPLDVCPAGTELVLVPREQLTIDEVDSLKRLTDPRKVDPAVRILPFRWDGRVRFLRLGTQAIPDLAGSRRVAR